ncbi:MAG: AraC family transcriptional regulator ligand-binding domain-containing protein [Alphaproteobacteria bacterium]
MIEIVRADTLRGFRELVSELGGDPDALLRAAHLDVASRGSPDAYISFRAVATLLERTASELKCPDFGMRLAERRSEDSLGPLAIVMQNAETARESIGYAERYMHFHNLALTAQLEPAEDAQDCEFLRLEHRLSRPLKMLQSAERMVCFSARFIGMISGAPPREIWFPHARFAPLTAYRAHFGASSVRFSMPRQGLVITREALEAPRVADAQLKRIAEHFLQNTAPPRAETVSSRARVVIDRMMRTGDCTQADLARALGLHERTLQRRLQTEGTTFETIKDEVRREMAREFLAQPNVSFSRVAELLGYAETSALTRSSRRWFNATPSAMRKLLRNEAA